MPGDSDATRLPDRIGPYRVLQLLGEGGMGIVYEAEDTGPVRRRVAVKVMRAGLNSREVVARFEAERQALAVMSHPGIAGVLTAGTTETGEPYFAMELVRGRTLTEYCDHHRLSLTDRLELFIAVCHAVQHAHQKGVSHRDLKPSNVLVTEQDGRPQPKIIDFGIAKAMGQQLTDTAFVTLTGQAIGTAAYMSPEQADPTGTDADTRTDIYSLGVMLYELLVGELPLDPGQMGLHRFLTRLAAGDTNPPTPSARLSARRDAAASVAYLRQTSTEHLRRALRGDLDWIVMKAMATERAQRYETANGLALDLHRHLVHEPVLARPPLATYQIAKFVRRHRWGVIASAVILVTVLAGTVAATIGFVRASRAERLAAQEAAAALAVTDFLVSLFREADPTRTQGNTLTARQILDQGASRANTELALQPILRGRLLHTLGTVYDALGLFDPAREQFLAALMVRREALGPRSLEAAETEHALGDVARNRGDLEASEQFLQDALAIRQEILGSRHVDVTSAMASLAALRVRQGRAAEAESLYVTILALDEGIRPRTDPRVARNQRGLAAAVYKQGRYAEADSLYQQVLALQVQTLGADHLEVAGTLINIGALYWDQKRYADALPMYDRARTIYERVVGPSHAEIAGIYNNLAETYWMLRRHAEAEPLFRRALEIKERTLSPEAPAVATTLNGLAGLLRDEGRLVESELLYRRALVIRERAFGQSNASTQETLRDYAIMLRRAGREREASDLENRIVEGTPR